jgi:uncharacterized membrane protein (UPF0136 family)
MKLNEDVGPGQPIWAVLMTITGLLSFLRQPSIESVLGGCGSLLYAWSLLCYPVPGFRSVPSRKGSQPTPLNVATLVMMLGLILMMVSVVMFFSRR